jgi:hypothetical protein
VLGPVLAVAALIAKAANGVKVTAAGSEEAEGSHPHGA